jgi:ferritin
MISKKMEAALNGQLQKEMQSAHLYLAMSAWFEDENWGGCAHWMRVQVGEESGHAMKLYRYILEQNGRVLIGALEKPETEWDSPVAAFKAAYKHEQYITGQINELMALAIEEKDFATQAFLQWYVTEQVEEEKSTLDIVNQLEMIGGASQGMFMLDRGLAQRGK